jgi:hypothetical protein
MLGLDLHGWEAVVVWSLGIAALAAIAVVVSTRIVIIMQREALRDSAEKIALATEGAATANARAAEANLELAKLKERVSPRVLTKAQLETLKALKGNVGEIAVVWVSDSEAAMFGWQIRRALSELGILVTSPPLLPGKVVAGLFAIFPEAINPVQKRVLAAILSDAGIGEGMSRAWLPLDIPSDLIVIVVGQKPLEYASPETK